MLNEKDQYQFNLCLLSIEKKLLWDVFTLAEHWEEKESRDGQLLSTFSNSQNVLF